MGSPLLLVFGLRIQKQRFQGLLSCFLDRGELSTAGLNFKLSLYLDRLL